MEKPFILVVRFLLRVLDQGIFAIDEDEPSTEEDRRVGWIGVTLSLDTHCIRHAGRLEMYM